MNEAPEDWRRDGFLVDRSPIVVTSRFGQNARVGIPGHEADEALDWRLERDYSKVAFLTVAIATSIRCVPATGGGCGCGCGGGRTLERGRSRL